LTYHTAQHELTDGFQAVIHESSLPIIIDANRRLPFEAYSTTSEGAFGQVRKVTISPRYFFTEAGFSNAFQV
jgi:hypothetical protein